MSTWRERAAPIIANELALHKNSSEQELRRALREAYPFGERAMWPYKVWLDEIRRQRGLKAKKRDKDSRQQGLPFD